jgi:Mg-chelatase subunit ChlI
MDLGAELDLAGEAARAFSRVKVAEQLRLAISRLRAGWYVMPAGRSADAVIARIARSLAATDGSTKITQELMGEARSIMLSMNQMEGART